MTGAELCLRAAAGQEVSAVELLAWMRKAGRGGGRDFAATLGLGRPALIKARNAALLDAAGILGSDGCTTWALAGRMADAVARFESRLWPRLRAGAADDLGPVDCALHRAFLAGVGMSRTRRKLYGWLMIHR